jgi:hypothetical protein
MCPNSLCGLRRSIRVKALRVTYLRFIDSATSPRSVAQLSAARAACSCVVGLTARRGCGTCLQQVRAHMHSRVRVLQTTTRTNAKSSPDLIPSADMHRRAMSNRLF